MKKLALKIENLSVESFETAAEKPERGTVQAHATTGNQIICECTYDVGTCDYTCANCGGGGGTGGTGLNCTNYDTCATGRQIIFGC